jgi:chromosome condensin MukBEF ATPase and DNA-binding subunit MukB
VPSGEQQTGVPGSGEEQSEASCGLKLASSADVMPHLEARLSQESPEIVSMDEQADSRLEI